MVGATRARWTASWPTSLITPDRRKTKAQRALPEVGDPVRGWSAICSMSLAKEVSAPLLALFVALLPCLQAACVQGARHG
ncbi:hypothetical protein CI15_27625 [Paraburkholderia monticola]|uniref:Uncharacterized protein n=1 Tax=Paraburkholderia monticola TaxID=1399968 RepID=A0A149PD04_9BURK|nr:hypothetical protein CI15_27625 [Paraburkholderia monticola]